MVEATDARLKMVDVYKGFTIMAIVIVHLALLSLINRDATSAVETVADSSTPGMMSLILETIYLGLMSFFFISGYFYRPGRGFAINMGKRAKYILASLLICALTIPLILYAYATILGLDPGIQSLIDGLLQSLGLHGAFQASDFPLYSPLCSGSVGYYYLWTMLLSFIVFYGLADRVYGDLKKEIAVIAILLVLGCIYYETIDLRLPFYAQLTFIGTACMFLGMVLSERKVLERISAPKPFRWSYPAGFIVCLLSAVVLVYFFHPGMSLDESFYGEYGGYSIFTYFAEASLMFIVYAYIMFFFSKIPGLSKFLSELGQHTLGILLLHLFVSRLLLMPFFTYSGRVIPEADFMILLPMAFVTLIICYLICKFGPRILKGLINRIRGGEGSGAVQGKE